MAIPDASEIFGPLDELSKELRRSYELALETFYGLQSRSDALKGSRIPLEGAGRANDQQEPVGYGAPSDPTGDLASTRAGLKGFLRLAAKDVRHAHGELEEAQRKLGLMWHHLAELEEELAGDLPPIRAHRTTHAGKDPER